MQEMQSTVHGIARVGQDLATKHHWHGTNFLYLKERVPKSHVQCKMTPQSLYVYKPKVSIPQQLFF